MTRDELKKEIMECIYAYGSEPMIIYKGKNCAVLDKDDINRIAYRCACHILGSFVNDEIVSVPKQEYELLLNNKKHETDLLKEFVEFVEDRLTILIKDESYQANIAEAENDNLKKNMSLLMADTIGAIKNSMKPALEKFLEENEDGRRD